MARYNYSDKDYIHKISMYFVKNDSSFKGFLDIFGEQGIGLLVDEIYSELNDITNEQDYISLLIINTAIYEYTMIIMEEILKRHYEQFKMDPERIPKEEIEKYYEMKAFSTIALSKKVVMGWIFKEIFGYLFDPSQYDKRIKEHVSEFTSKNFKHDNANYKNQYQSNSDTIKDYYEILEVSRNASLEIITKSYKTLVKRYHPDVSKLDVETATKKLLEVQEAYEVLSNPDKKMPYDKKLSFNNSKENSKESQQYNNQEPSAHVTRKNRTHIVVKLAIAILVVTTLFIALIEGDNDSLVTQPTNPTQFTQSTKPTQLEIVKYLNENSYTDSTQNIYQDIIFNPNGTVDFFGNNYILREKDGGRYLVLNESGFVDLYEEIPEGTMLVAQFEDVARVSSYYDANSISLNVLNQNDVLVVFGEKNNWLFGTYSNSGSEREFGWVPKNKTKVWLANENGLLDIVYD